MRAHLTPDDVQRLRVAYQVLGVPPSSAAPEITRAFRRLAKTWHPDKWPLGTPQQAKAAERMREINGAYQAVRHAPLRYHIEGHPRVAARAVETGRPVRRETVPVSDHSEWLIRFFLGAAFGAVVNLLLPFAGVEVTPVLWIVVPLAFGLGFAFFGNEFWGWLIESFWWDLF